MTIKEKAKGSVNLHRIMFSEDFEREARSFIMSLLDDAQKFSFMMMARREQELFVATALKEIGIKTPEVILE